MMGYVVVTLDEETIILSVCLFFYGMHDLFCPCINGSKIAKIKT